MNRKFLFVLLTLVAGTVAIDTSASAGLCDPGECHFKKMPLELMLRMMAPDLTPVSMEVYRDANGDSARDILVCLTFANNGVGNILEQDSSGNQIEFDIDKQLGSASQTYEATLEGPLPGYMSTPDNLMTLESDPRVGSSAIDNPTVPIPVTYILDAAGDIAEKNEKNNQITVLYVPAEAEERESCGFDEESE